MQEYIKIFRIRNSNTNNTKWWNGRYYENVKSLEDTYLLLKGVSKTIQNEGNKQKGEFLSMLLGRLGASLLENMLAGKGITRAGYGNKKEKETIRASYGFKLDFWYQLIL